MSSRPKREFSKSARRAQLDKSVKPRRMVPTYCFDCKRVRHFYDVRIWGLTNAERNIVPADARKVRGICMWCGAVKMFIVPMKHLTTNRYDLTRICACGLPIDHKPPCRPITRDRQRIHRLLAHRLPSNA